MTFKKALMVSLLSVVSLSALLIGAVGYRTIGNSVIREAQERVNHDLRISHHFYTRQLDELAQTTAQACNCLALEDPELGPRLARIRQDLGLDVLNLVDDRGTPVAGAFEDEPQPVALGLDPVLSAAKRGTLAFGTVKRADSLWWWIALPLFDKSGQVVGLVYGGRSLDKDAALVDQLRDQLFGPVLYQGKPLGTVTLFRDDIRIATNVRAADGRRAIGTRVSPAVAKTVLEGGRRWTDRAKVVDAWYISAYEPLRDPAGRIVGMLYVGLLEAPYDELKRELVFNFGLGLGLMLLIGLLVAVVLIHKAVRPIKQLSAAAVHMSHGQFDQAIAAGHTYTEFNHLIEMFQQMQEAIGLRDKRLKEHNQQLAERHEEVQQANRSYLEMLAFVTHELKSPLVAIQTLINTLVEGYLGEVPEPMAKPLSRIQHRCEELQDMVKNYLDLSRYERGELRATRISFDFRTEVVDACVQQTAELFSSNDVTLTVECPEALEVIADPELMRIAVSNYLTNASKYGRAGGQAKLQVTASDREITVSVFNEGDGFGEEEGQRLFGKFARLRGEATRRKKGSGLGLFLVKQILELHDGQVGADSEPGTSATFTLSFPGMLPKDEQ